MRSILALFGTLVLASTVWAPSTLGQAAAATVTPGETLSLVATAYGPSLKDNYPYGAVDYYGRPLKPGDVAVDPRVIPLGTRLYVSGYHTPLLPSGGFEAVAVDTGGAIKGDRIDLFIDAPDAKVQTFGIQNVKVTILGKNGQVPTTTPARSGSGSSSGSVSGTSSSASSGGPSGSLGSPVASMAPSAQSLKGWTIVVDPGHGRDPRYGNFTGAEGVNGVSEDQNVLDIGQRLVTQLRLQGATVYITRGAYDPAPPPVQGLIKRVSLAEAVHADLFISIHENDGASSSHGVQTWYYWPRSAALARDVQQAMVADSGLANAGIHQRGFYVVYHTTMPAILVEGGFLSNPSEAALISTASFHARESSALDSAILTYVKANPKS